MGTSSTTATDLLPKGTPTSATPSGANLPSGPSNLPPGLSYGPSSLGDAGTGPASTPPPTPTPMPSYTPPDAAIQHLPFLDPPSPFSNELPSTGTGKGSEVHNLWQPHKNEPVSFASTQPDSPSAAQTSRDQIQAWKSRVEAQTQQQAKAAAPAPTLKPMSVTPKRPSPLSAEARASNGRLAEAMARASDPTQILPILKDAQDIDPVQFKAEFQDISDQLWQNLPAHRREAAHQDFMTQAKKALGWDQRPSQDTRPSQATPNPHPDTKGATRPHSSQETRPIPAEGQSTAGPVAAQSASTGSEAPEPTQSSGSSTTPESDSALERYDVQRNPHTGEAHLYDPQTRELVRNSDGTPTAIANPSVFVTKHDIQMTRQRENTMTDVLARIRDDRFLEPSEAQELIQKVKEAYPYAPDLHFDVEYMLKSHEMSINKDYSNASVDSFESINQQLKDPSFQAKYEQNIQHLNRIKTGYQGGVPKYQSDRGAAIERQNDAARKVISAYAKVQSFNSGSQGPINSQSQIHDKRLLQEASAEFKAAMSETSKYMDLPYPDSSLGMDKKFKAAETAGQDRRDLLIGTALFLAGGLAGSGAKAVAMMAFKRLGKSAASMEFAGTAAKLLASNGVRVADVYNAYQTGVREAIDTVLKDATTAQGKPIDWSDPVARHDALSNNPTLQKTITDAGERYAFATFIGSKAGAAVGTVADVAAPGMNPFIRYMGEHAISNTTKDALIDLHKSNQ
jgi:hypothetical protein